MQQTRKYSFIESITNIICGYGVAVLSQIIIFPFFNIRIPLSDNFIIGLWFTVISLGRSYALRRFFTNKTSVKKEQIVFRPKRLWE